MPKKKKSTYNIDEEIIIGYNTKKGKDKHQSEKNNGKNKKKKKGKWNKVKKVLLTILKIILILAILRWNIRISIYFSSI